MNYTDEQLREIDALVAEKVMGCRVEKCGHAFNVFCRCDPRRIHGKFPHDEILRYTSDISAAWEVVEKMRELNNGDVTEFRFTWRGTKNPGYCFRIWESDLEVDMEEFRADTPALAICLAALKAKGVGIPDPRGE